jgi:DNA polymerase III subunit delta
LILQSLEDLESELRNGRFRPVYLILGPEQYLCRRAINLLKSQAINADSAVFDYSEFVAGEASVDEMIEAASTFPMISKRRLVLVTEADRLTDSEQDSLLEAIIRISPRSTLVLSAENLDHRKRFYKTLREESCVAEFPKLKGPALGQWADAFFKKQGHTISASALRKIVDLAGANLQSLAMELEKLILYAGSAKNIPDSAVDDLVRGSRQQSIFDLTDAIGRRDRGSALRSLANLLNMGEHPFVVITMMARHCRQVMIAQEYLLRGKPTREITAAAQIPPFLLDQFLRQARTADSDSIRRMFIRLADIDRRLKSSSVDGRLLLENLICTLV